jgi:hypothetical protein
MHDPRYPIGPFTSAGRSLSQAEREACIEVLAGHPARVRESVEGLPDGRLDVPYRDGGWTLRQLTHHLADSHLNAYVRFRLALTEDHPTIRPYDQDAWARLSDARAAPVAPSLQLLEAIHARWVMLLHAMTPEDFERTLRHPEIGDVTLDYMLEQYAWHAEHHEAHLSGAPS